MPGAQPMAPSGDLDWKKAGDRLREVRVTYAEIGVAGIPAMRLFIDPVTARFEKGERTQELYDEIMGFE